jgi:hypothetical protein
LRPDFDAALPEERRPDAFAEDFDEDLDFGDFDEALREAFADDFAPEDLRGLLADEPAEDLREAVARFAAAFAVRETAFDVRPASLRAARVVFCAASLALAESTAAVPGRIKSPAAGLTAPTASAAVSRAADASPAACSPACPISLEAASTAPPKTPRATSSAPPPLFFLAIFDSLSCQRSAFSLQPNPLRGLCVLRG